MYVNVACPESYLLRRRRELAEHKVQRPDIFLLRGVMTFSDGSVYPEEGILDFADVTLRSQTGMLQARFYLSQSRKGVFSRTILFLPGQFVKIRLKGYIRTDAILIPQRAVQQGPKGSFVYVIDKGDKAELRPSTGQHMAWRRMADREGLPSGGAGGRGRISSNSAGNSGKCDPI